MTEQDWSHLKGKKLVESKDAVGDNTFMKSDLPEGARVVPNGYPMTKDFQPDRLTVILDEDNVVEHVGMY